MTQDEEMPTLGRLLDRQARRIAARHVPEFGWAEGFSVMLQRMQRLAVPHADRFARVETVSVTDLPQLPVPPLDQGYWHDEHRGHDGLDDHTPLTPTRTSAPADEAHPADPAATPADTPDTDVHRAADPAPATPSRDQRLPGDVAERLRRIIGPTADAMVVHTDSPADTLARAEHADAVTLGTDVYFRQGQYRPRHTEGFALLAHEATHVAASQTAGNAWRRYTAGAEEESRALAREHASLGAATGLPGDPARPAAHNATAAGHAFGGTSPGWAARPPASISAPAQHQNAPAAAVPGAAQTAMRAEADRPRTSEQPAGIDVDRLRRDLLDDLRRQLRTEFERGG